MTTHYATSTPEDEVLVAQTFRGFVEKHDTKGQPSTQAVFYCEKGSIPGIGAPYDLLRPIFRVTGATTAGVGRLSLNEGYRVTVASPKQVRSRIEEILAKYKPDVTNKMPAPIAR